MISDTKGIVGLGKENQQGCQARKRLGVGGAVTCLVYLLVSSQANAENRVDAPIALRAGMWVSSGPRLFVSVANRKLKAEPPWGLAAAGLYLGKWWGVGICACYGTCS